MKFILAMLVCLGLQAKTNTLTPDNHVFLNGAFTNETVAKVQDQFLKLSKNSSQELYLVLNSPGGSVTAGNALIETLKNLPNPVHTISIFSASMAYLTVQSLGKRYILNTGTIMSHRASIRGLSGEIPGELINKLNYILSMLTELDRMAANRVGLNVDTYKELIRDELWLFGSNAVEAKHVDEVVSIKCSESLNKTYTKRFRSFFGYVDVEFSKCPLITGPVNIKSGNTRIRKMIKDKYNMKKKKDFSFTL